MRFSALFVKALVGFCRSSILDSLPSQSLTVGITDLTVSPTCRSNPEWARPIDFGIRYPYLYKRHGLKKSFVLSRITASCIVIFSIIDDHVVRDAPANIPTHKTQRTQNSGEHQLGSP